MLSDDFKPRNISRLQYGMLRYIRDNAPTVVQMQRASNGTLGSLAYWRWIMKVGSGEHAQIVITPDGEEMVRLYERATMEETKTAHLMTERCIKLLKYRTRVTQMHHRGAA